MLQFLKSLLMILHSKDLHIQYTSSATKFDSAPLPGPINPGPSHFDHHAWIAVPLRSSSTITCLAA
jgi:hypothetical protein